MKWNSDAGKEWLSSATQTMKFRFIDFLILFYRYLSVFLVGKPISHFNRLLLIIFWLVSPLLQAEPMGLVLNDEAKNIKINPYLYILEDPDRKLTIEQIISPKYTRQFVKNTTARESFGRSQSVYWMYFDITIASKQQWYLLFDHTLIGELALFTTSKSSPATFVATPFPRIENYRTPLFALNSTHQKKLRIYLRVSSSKRVLLLPIRLVKPLELVKISQFNSMFYSFILAGLIILSLYNLFLYFSLREPSYLALIVLIMALLIILYRDSNLFSILSFLNKESNDFFSAPELIGMAAALQYWRYINDNSNILLDRFLQVVIWGHLIMIPFIAFIPMNQYWIYLIATLLFPIFILWISKTAWAGHQPTIGIYWAAIVFILTVFPSLLAQINLIQYSSNIIYLAHIGILVATLLLSLSQAEFMRKLRIRAAQLDTKNKAKDKFLSTMSHELRTPMHAVVGVGELLKQTSLTNEQSRYVQTLETASGHMLNTIDDILDFSQIEGNYLKLKPVNFQLNHLLLQMQELFDIPAMNKGLTLNINLISPVTNELKGDVTRLSQVLVNLLGNAVKYTQSGTIELRVEPLKSNSQHHLVLLFKIIDTGIGIDEQQQRQLFNPFYQVDEGSTRKFTGSGLGLSISHHLIEKMGGKLEVKSTLGKGSCFFFTLIYPINKKTKDKQYRQKQYGHPQDKIECLSNQGNALEGACVLLVDDDEINLFIGENSLQKLGAIVITADNGEEAIQQIQQHYFDFVFMDINMPKMDGYETAKQIRANPNYQQLPIIALTADTMINKNPDYIQSGMNDFLVKPFKIEELKDISEYWFKQAK